MQTRFAGISRTVTVFCGKQILSLTMTPMLESTDWKNQEQLLDFFDQDILQLPFGNSKSNCECYLTVHDI